MELVYALAPFPDATKFSYAYLVLVRGLLLSVNGEEFGLPTEEACFLRGVEVFEATASQSSPVKILRSASLFIQNNGIF